MVFWKKIPIFLIAGISVFIAAYAHAACPVCAVAAGAGVGLARWVGIDDVISGIWIGGLLMALSIWTINWLNAKRIRFMGRKPLIFFTYYAITIIPLYSMGIMGDSYNMLWGVDKILLGVITGSIGFAGGIAWYERMKARNDGHAHFPLEKVVISVGVLFVLSGIFYFITKTTL